MKQEAKTEVIFLVAKGVNDLYAYFPKEIEGYGLRSCYSHVGQHSICSIEYAQNSRLARKTEYEELYNELTSLGYNLDVLKNRYSLYQS
jgi:hypothetical protein